MKEFKEDKFELESKIARLINDFNKKYDVYDVSVNDVEICYIGINGYVKIKINIGI